MEIDEIIRLRARMDKAGQIRTRLALLPKLSERVFRDVPEIERRCLEAVGTAEEDAIMAFLDKNAERLKQQGEKDASLQKHAKEAGEVLRQAFAEPEAFSGKLDDPTIDVLLDRGLTIVEQAQAELEVHLFELQTIGAELDQILNKKRPLS